MWDDPAVDWGSFDVVIIRSAWDCHERRDGLAGIPPTAYARIDLLPTDSGPVVLEVEVTEPSLYLNFDDEAPERAATVFRSLAP